MRILWFCKLCVLMSVSLLLPLPIHAQQTGNRAPMPTWIEEFFRSEAVRSEEKGELQSTFDAEGFRNNGADGDLDFEYGLTNRMQLSAELPYGIRSATKAEVPLSWSIVTIGAEYQFVRSIRPFALTAGLSTDIPATARGEFGWEPEILAAKQFGNTQLHVGFIADLASDAREYKYNLATVMNLHSAWFPTLEFNDRRTDMGANLFYVTPGIYRHFSHHIEAGIAISAGSYLGAVGKVTWEVGGDKD